MPIEITSGYRRPDGQWPPRCPVCWAGARLYQLFVEPALKAGGSGHSC
jgi:hypothetical protein